MANLYFNGSVDTTWDTRIGNWWLDAAFTNQAPALPTAGDTVYLAAQMDYGPSIPVTLNHIYVADASTGGGAFYVVVTGATGDVTFYDSSFFFGTITGNAIFNDTSICSDDITGNATFYDSSYVSAVLSSTFGGIATFYDSSHNDGYLPYGECIFRDSSRNTGQIDGTATVYYDGGNGERPIGGIVNSVTYIGFPLSSLYFNAAVDGTWDELGNWWFDTAFSDPASLPLEGETVYIAAQMDSGPSTAVTLNHIYVADASTGGSGFGVVFDGAIGNATINNSCINYGTITGDATFNTGSINDLATVTGNAIFNDSSFNQNGGTITGDATFNTDSYNEFGGIVIGNAEFNASGWNSGLVSINATFNDSSINYSDVYGDATFNDSSTNQSGSVNGVATFAITSAIVQISNSYGGTYGSVSIAGGGGGDQTIARLLNLPWFINL